MPKTSSNLLGTEMEIRHATSQAERTDYRIKGAPGLQLRVTSGGTKTWAYAYKRSGSGKWSKAALGRWPDVKLADAKLLAKKVGGDIAHGKDPLRTAGAASEAASFRELAEQYMVEHKARNARGDRISTSSGEAERQLERDVYPVIAAMRPEEVKRAQIVRIVEGVAGRGSYVAADRALGLIRAIYNWAVGTGRLDVNPTLGLKKRNTSKPKKRALSPAELAAVWQGLPTAPGVGPEVSAALRLQLLTACRIDEVMGAARSELNLVDGIWTIPAVRTKAEREHILPLSKYAVDLFREAMAQSDQDAQRRARRRGMPHVVSPFVFPRVCGDQPLGGHVASRAMVRCREHFETLAVEPFNTHDLRRTVATGMGELGVSEDIITRILNHAPTSVTGRHYNHAKMLPAMRDALVAWERHIIELLSHADVPGRLLLAS